MKIIIANTLRISALNILLESLSELEHKQWMAWAKDLLKKEDLSDNRKERWEKLFVPYKNLSEDMKKEDRKYAQKVLDILKRLK
jgi:HEPN domain-containing protein